MRQPSMKPRWAPRVPQHKIRRLYELDAQGIVDEELIAHVGFALYDRCCSILIVRDMYAYHRVPCPQCDQYIGLAPAIFEQPHALVHCDHCGWHLLWKDYAATFRHQELGAGGAAEIFQTFLAAWERSSTARERMLLIDRLIHAWHWQTQTQRPRFGLGRPTGVNLIEGNRKSVLALLDTLTYGPQSSAGTQATKMEWRQRWEEVKLQQAKGQRRKRGNSSQRPGRDGCTERDA